MNRICERFKSEVALTPVSLATETDSTPIYLDCSDYKTVDFIISHGALASGKKINVAVYVADDASATNAAKLDDEDFTAGASMTNGVLVASVNIAGERKGFYGIKLNHDNTSAVVVSAVMIGETRYTPGEDCLVRV